MILSFGGNHCKSFIIVGVYHCKAPIRHVQELLCMQGGGDQISLVSFPYGRIAQATLRAAQTTTDIWGGGG